MDELRHFVKNARDKFHTHAHGKTDGHYQHRLSVDVRGCYDPDARCRHGSEHQKCSTTEFAVGEEGEELTHNRQET